MIAGSEELLPLHIAFQIEENDLFMSNMLSNMQQAEFLIQFLHKILHSWNCRVVEVLEQERNFKRRGNMRHECLLLRLVDSITGVSDSYNIIQSH